jgi:hypothetical protein
MSTGSAIFLIANCAATKRVSGPSIALGRWAGTPRQRFRWWRRAIEEESARIPARECYGGDAWGQVLAAEEDAGIGCQLWVVSAGLGLISADFPIPNYSATFVRGEIDSVAGSSAGEGEWWELLVKWGRERTGIASISDLARLNPRAKFFVALSATYLRVVKQDLLAARCALESPENLIVISAGTRPSAALGKSLLPIEGRFENLVGGARATLNARMLRYTIKNREKLGSNAADIALSLEKISEDLGAVRRFERQKLDDTDVCDFIRDLLAVSPKPSASAFLTALRSKGGACEQKRFRELFNLVRNS